MEGGVDCSRTVSSPSLGAGKKVGKILAVRVQMLDDTITMFQIQVKWGGRKKEKNLLWVPTNLKEVTGRGSRSSPSRSTLLIYFQALKEKCRLTIGCGVPSIHPIIYIFFPLLREEEFYVRLQREILSFSGCQIYLYVRNHLWGPSPFGRFTWFTLWIRCSKCSLYYWLERACYSMRPVLLVSRDLNPLIVATRSIFLLLVSLLHTFIFQTWFCLTGQSSGQCLVWPGLSAGQSSGGRLLWSRICRSGEGQILVGHGETHEPAVGAFLDRPSAPFRCQILRPRSCTIRRGVHSLPLLHADQTGSVSRSASV